MKIEKESKFDIKQNVYCIEEYKKEDVCEFCQGNKKITITNTKKSLEVDCPFCYGSGKHGENRMILWRLKYEGLSCRIDGISFWLWQSNKDPKFSYSVNYAFPKGGYCSTSVSEDNCFGTLEEALAEVEKRNANPKYEEDWE